MRRDTSLTARTGFFFRPTTNRLVTCSMSSAGTPPSTIGCRRGRRCVGGHRGGPLRRCGIRLFKHGGRCGAPSSSSSYTGFVIGCWWFGCSFVPDTERAMMPGGTTAPVTPWGIKKPWSGSGPRLVAVVGGVAAGSQLEVGADLPSATPSVGAFVRGNAQFGRFMVCVPLSMKVNCRSARDGEGVRTRGLGRVTERQSTSGSEPLSRKPPGRAGITRMNGRLLRSRHERMIGGVAGGIGQQLGVDPTWVRIAWVLLAIATNGDGQDDARSAARWGRPSMPPRPAPIIRSCTAIAAAVLRQFSSPAAFLTAARTGRDCRSVTRPAARHCALHLVPGGPAIHPMESGTQTRGPCPRTKAPYRWRRGRELRHLQPH